MDETLNTLRELGFSDHLLAALQDAEKNYPNFSPQEVVNQLFATEQADSNQLYIGKTGAPQHLVVD